MKSVDAIICRLLVRRRSNLLNPHLLTQFFEENWLELLALIRQNSSWHTESREEIVDQYFCDNWSRVRPHRVSFGPFRKDVDNCDDVFVCFR